MVFTVQTNYQQSMNETGGGLKWQGSMTSAPKLAFAWVKTLMSTQAAHQSQAHTTQGHTSIICYKTVIGHTAV